MVNQRLLEWVSEEVGVVVEEAKGTGREKEDGVPLY